MQMLFCITYRKTFKWEDMFFYIVRWVMFQHLDTRFDEDAEKRYNELLVKQSRRIPLYPKLDVRRR